jgi:hypothetical protein
MMLDRLCQCKERTPLFALQPKHFVANGFGAEIGVSIIPRPKWQAILVFHACRPGPGIFIFLTQQVPRHFLHIKLLIAVLLIVVDKSPTSR